MAVGSPSVARHERLLDRTDDEMHFRTAAFVLRRAANGACGTLAETAGRTIAAELIPRTACGMPSPMTGFDGEIRVWNVWYRGDRTGQVWPPVIVREGRLSHVVLHSQERRLLSWLRQSADGLHWTRKDGEIGIGRSATGRTADDLLCGSPPLKDKWIMFYSGSSFGRTGVGVAELETD